jgi:hypothetical protein
MTPRPERCRYCGTAIEQASTGRPRQFCSDAHKEACRKANLRAKALLSLEPNMPPPLVLIDRAAPPEQRMRALHAELRSTSRACFEVANLLERRSDLPQHGWRFAAVGVDLERSIDKNFADLEGDAL